METIWKKQMKVGGQGAQPMKCITETHTTQEEVKHTHTRTKTKQEYLVTLAEVDRIWWLATILERMVVNIKMRMWIEL